MTGKPLRRLVLHFTPQDPERCPCPKEANCGGVRPTLAVADCWEHGVTGGRPINPILPVHKHLVEG